MKQRCIRFLIGLLCLGVLLCYLPAVAAHAEETAAHTPWQEGNFLPTDAGSYRLEADVTMDRDWVISQEVRLCLNGFRVDLNGHQLLVEESGSLEILDCGQTNPQQYYVNLETAPESAEGVLLFAAEAQEGYFPLPAPGGVISGGGEDAIVVNGGSLTLAGGNLCGNLAGNRGTVLVTGEGRFTMSGGSVSYNHCTASGGGVYGESGEVCITGDAVITCNRSQSGGGVTVTGAKLTLGGAARIAGNAGGNLYLDEAQGIALDGLEGGEIGISTANPEIPLTLEAVTETAFSCFTPDNAEDTLTTTEEGRLAIAPKPITAEEIAPQAATSAFTVEGVGDYNSVYDAVRNVPDGGTVNLNYSVTTPEGEQYYLMYNHDKNATINLNGNRITSTYSGNNYGILAAQGTLNLTNGTVSVSNTAHAIATAGSGNINLGENLTVISVSGHALYAAAGTITVEGAVVTGGFKCDSGSIIIKSGSFSADPTNYLAQGAAMVYDAGRYYVNCVAKIGDRGFATLQDAINAAAEGQTVKLLMDTYECITVSKSITIDLGGYSIRRNSDNKMVVVTSGALTLQNGTLDGEEATYSAQNLVDLYSNTRLTATKVNFQDCISQFGAIFSNTNTVIDLTNCSLQNNRTNPGYNNACGSAIHAYGQVWLTNCTIAGNHEHRTSDSQGDHSYPIHLKSQGSLHLSGNIQFSGNTRGDSSTPADLMLFPSGSQVYITGALTGSNINVTPLSDAKLVATGSGGYTVTAADAAVFHCTKADEFPALNAADNTVILRGPVAQIGNTTYGTLQEALAAVPENGIQTTVTLLRDVTEICTVVEGQNVILDLGGHTVTAPADKQYAVGNYNGTLTVQNGTIVSSSNYAVIVIGTTTLENVTVEQSGEGIAVATISPVTIKSSTITHQENGIALGVQNNGSITVQDGMVTGTLEHFGNTGTFTINGGTFTANPSAYVPAGTAVGYDGSHYYVGKVAKIGTTLYDTLPNAVAAVGNGQTIELLADIPVSTEITINRSGISFTLDGKGHTVKRVAGYNGNLFKALACTATFTNVTVDGGADWVGDNPVTRTGTFYVMDGGSGFLLNLQGANITLGNGAILQNNYLTGSSDGVSHYGSAVHASNGVFTMKDGSKILNNTVHNTGKPLVGGDGAAISLWNYVVVNIDGGEISGNYAPRMGGAIRVANGNATLNISGGTITNNWTKAHQFGNLCLLGNLKFSGSPVIQDNWAVESNSASDVANKVQSNVVLYNNGVIDAAELNVTKPIMISTAGNDDNNDGVANRRAATIVKVGAERAADMFTTAIDQYVIALENNNLVTKALTGEILYVDPNAAAAGADGSRNHPYTELNATVLNHASLASGGHIVLLNFDKAGTYKAHRKAAYYSFNSNSYAKDATLTILGEGSGKTVSDRHRSTSTYWHLEKNFNLVLDNVIMDGTDEPNADNYGAFFIGEGSSLTLKNGAVIQNYKNRGVNVRPGGILNLYEGTSILYNKAGLNEYYNGDNTSGVANAGGGIYVCPGGVVQFENSSGRYADQPITISGNTGTQGAGIYLASGSYLNTAYAHAQIDDQIYVNPYADNDYVANRYPSYTLVSSMDFHTHQQMAEIYLASGATVRNNGTQQTQVNIDMANTAYGTLAVYMTRGGADADKFQAKDGKFNLVLRDSTLMIAPETHTCSGIEHQAWFSGMTPPTGGNWYLYEDITLSASWTPTGNVNLCLHGGMLNLSGGIIQMNSGLSLDIRDCSTAQYYVNLTEAPARDTAITFNTAGGTGFTALPETGGVICGAPSEAIILNGSTLNLHGGNISGNTKGSYGQILTRYAGAKLNIYGGSVSFNYGNSYGAVTIENNAVMQMSGGTIACNGGNLGGGIYSKNAGSSVTITGGKIHHNTAPNGGGIYAHDSAALTIGGTTEIYSNTATNYGGGIYLSNPATLNLSGKVTVSGNTDANGAASNLYLNAAHITLAEGGLTAGSVIGIGKEGAQIGTQLSTNWIGEEAATLVCFTSDDSRYIVDKLNGVLVLSELHAHADGLTFRPWLDGTSLPTAAGYYRLETDVTLSEEMAVSGDVHLCLNGHMVRPAAEGKRILLVNANSTLSLYDCREDVQYYVNPETQEISAAQGEGYVPLPAPGGVLTGAVVSGTNQWGGAIYVMAGATLNLHGGNISGNTISGTNYGAGVHNSGTFHMTGGSVSYNTNNGNRGGGVFTNGPEMTMSGGVIAGNTSAHDGAGVAMTANSFTMTGGTISGNTTAAGKAGGGILVDRSTFTMKGGIISGNSASHGGAAYCYNATLSISGGEITGNTANAAVGGVLTNRTASLSGSPRITGNTCSGEPSNLVIYDGYYVTFTDGGLTQGASIGLSKADAVPGTEISTNWSGEGETLLRYVSYDDPQYTLAKSESGKLILADLHTHEGGMKFQTWRAGMAVPTEGNWCLGEDIDLTQVWDVPAGEVNLCLNGHVLRQTGQYQRVIYLNTGAALSVYDCTNVQYYITPGKYGVEMHVSTVQSDGMEALPAPGGVIGGGNINSYSAGIFVWSGATVNFHGGNICGNTATGDGGGISSNGIVNMYGGASSHNQANQGAGLYSYKHTNYDAVINLHGGIITRNHANNGGGIAGVNNSVVNLTGGTVTENTAANYGGGVYINCYSTLGGTTQISGNTVKGNASNLYLACQVPIALDKAYSPQVPTGVGTARADGVFAKLTGDAVTMTDAAKQRPSFQSDVSGLYVYATEVEDTPGLKLSSDVTAEVLDGDGNLVASFGRVEDAVAYAQKMGLPKVHILRSTEVLTPMTVTQSLSISAEPEVALQVLTEKSFLTVSGQDTRAAIQGLTILGSREQTDEDLGIWEGEYLIQLKDNASLTLDGATVIRDAASGAVQVHSGTLIHQGTILECAAPTKGGGIQLNSGRLELAGGKVLQCASTDLGGGVYAAPGSLVAVSGAAQTDGSQEHGEEEIRSSNLYLAAAVDEDGIVTQKAALVQSGSLAEDARIRLRFTTDPQEGQDFGSILQSGYQGAACFFSDQEPNFVAQAGDNQTIVWTVKLPELAPAGIARMDIPALLMLSLLSALGAAWTFRREWE